MPENKPKTRFPDKQIEMAHGAGGKASRRLIEGLIAPVLVGPLLGGTRVVDMLVGDPLPRIC